MSRVFKRSELGFPAGAFQFLFVVILLREGHKESLLSEEIVSIGYEREMRMILPFLLQRHHCLLNVIVVALPLRLKPLCLLVKVG